MPPGTRSESILPRPVIRWQTVISLLHLAERAHNPRDAASSDGTRTHDELIEGFPHLVRVGVLGIHGRAEHFAEGFCGVLVEGALTVESVRTARGTRRYLPALREGSSENSGYWPSRELRKRVLLNTPIQGGGADLQVLAVNKFMGRLPDGVEVINLVHDEVDLILPSKAVLKPTTQVIRRAFQEAFAELYGTELVPQIKFSVGPSWGETKSITEDA